MTGRRARSRHRRLPGFVLAGLLAVVPFGSLGALQDRIVSGAVTDRVPQGRFICGKRDDCGRAAYQVAYVKRHEPTRPTVYMLGGSAVRECIISSDGLATAISNRCAVTPRVRNLASSEQKLAASLAIVDNLPAARGGIVVIGIHHTPFAYGHGGATRQLHGDEIMVRSTALRDFLEARLGNDYSASITAGIKLHLERYKKKRGVRAFRGASFAYLPHRYRQGVSWTDSFKRSRVGLWVHNRGRPGGPFYTYFDFNAAMLEKMVVLARAKGFEVLIMEDSQNAGLVGDAWDVYKDKYRTVCTRLVDEHGAHYVNINRNAGLVNRDFYDLIHLLPSGRRKWQPRLADSLAQIFADHPPPAAGPGSSPTPISSPADGDGSTSLSGLLASLGD